MYGYVSTTMVLHVQLTKQAIEVALPLALESNSSLVINHGIAPGPMAKNTIYKTANTIVI